MSIANININGSSLSDVDVVNLYNLGPTLMYAVDIFILSKNKESLDWVLAKNGDDTPKMQFVIDDSKTYNIESGKEGSTFSNPISYTRDSDVGVNVRKIPTHNTKIQKSISFIGGSTNSALGSNWSKMFPVESTEADNSLQLLNNGTLDDFLKFEIVVSAATDTALLDTHMANIIIHVAPSTFKGLKYNYLNYDSQNEVPSDIKKSVRY